MKLRPAIIASALCAALSVQGVLADKVVLKNGRTFTNVRANLGEQELEVETAEGRIYVFPAGDLKELQYGPFEKPQQIEKEKPGPETKADGGSAEEKPTEKINGRNDGSGCGFGYPVWESLLPVWSAHFCDGRTKLGIGFATADAFLLYGFLQWAGSNKTRNDDPVYLLTGILLAARQTTDADKVSTFLLWNYIGKDQIYTPQRIVLDRKTWVKRRNGLLALFMMSLVLDAGSVYWFHTQTGITRAPETEIRPFFILVPSLGTERPTAAAGFTALF